MLIMKLLTFGQEVNKTGTWLAAVAIVSAIVNLALFFLWFNLVRIEAEMPATERGYTVEALALNVTILEIILGVVAVILAFLAIFGFVEIKTAAVNRASEVAEDVAKQEASEQMKSFFRRQQEREDAITAVAGRYKPQTPPDEENIKEATEE